MGNSRNANSRIERQQRLPQGKNLQLSDIGGSMTNLALEIGNLYQIIVADYQMTYTATGKVHGRRTTQTAGTYHLKNPLKNPQ